jgi:hypothetical protein
MLFGSNHWRNFSVGMGDAVALSRATVPHASNGYSVIFVDLIMV